MEVLSAGLMDVTVVDNLAVGNLITSWIICAAVRLLSRVPIEQLDLSTCVGICALLVRL